MRKLILIPAMLLFVAASPQKIEPKRNQLLQRGYQEPLNTKLDSINVKAAELNTILRSGL